APILAGIRRTTSRSASFSWRGSRFERACRGPGSGSGRVPAADGFRQRRSRGGRPPLLTSFGPWTIISYICNPEAGKRSSSPRKSGREPVGGANRQTDGDELASELTASRPRYGPTSERSVPESDDAGWHAVPDAGVSLIRVVPRESPLVTGAGFGRRDGRFFDGPIAIQQRNAGKGVFCNHGKRPRARLQP